MNYSHLPKETREELGIGDNFFRLSIGIEDPNDLIQDLNQALDKALASSST
jgi:cystathionine beta-lyase/cystathionine gamma-synthase